jgi:trehalose 6-phosphate phosphatase
MSQPLSLWSHLDAVLQHCRTHECCVLLLDYDGTLTPIVNDPDAARLSRTMQRLLDTLAQHPCYRLAIVSGRALADLRTRVRGNKLYLAGNHGLEIEGPGIRYDHPTMQRLRPQMDAVAEALRHDLREIPGAWVEDKGYTLSVHVRSVPAALVPEVRARLFHHAGPAVDTGLLALRTGKAVLEVMPCVNWHKGKAVRWIVEHMRLEQPDVSLGVICMGDDDTDEDAFSVLGPADVGMVVGSDRPHSAAHYYVESVEETERLLAILSELTWPGAQGLPNSDAPS